MDKLDEYQKQELQLSWSNQLDVVGMQPHSREYLEYEMNCIRSTRKFEHLQGQTIDHPYGIQFSGSP